MKRATLGCVVLLVVLVSLVLGGLGGSGKAKQAGPATIEQEAQCTVTVQQGYSIQDAIDAAPEGAVVCLAEGEWAEHVTIEKALTLRGAGRDATLIRAVETYLPVVTIRGADDRAVAVTISGITVDGGAGWEGYGLLVTDSAQATITDCHVSGSFAGIELRDSAQGTITACTVSGSMAGIVLSGSPQGTIADCTIAANEYGIWLMGNPQATITACSISESGDAGIELLGDAQATITGSTISASGTAGIALKERAQATITGCSLLEGARFGLYLESSAQATILGNSIRDNGSYGVALGEQPCLFLFGTFAGYLTGAGNTGEGNADGDCCPEYLVFLFTEGGGELDRRE